MQHAPQPFEVAEFAANSLADSRLQSQLLGELAQLQLAAGLFSDALQTFANVPDPREQRIALLGADFAALPAEKVKPLVELLESHPQTERLAGRIAIGMLNASRDDTAYNTAWMLVETAFDPFESEQQRYDFLEKLLPKIHADDWSRVQRFYRSFIPSPFRDWASLALIKYLAEQGRYDEAERYADALSLPIRQSWAYWEMSRVVPEERQTLYFAKACRIAEGIAIVENDDEMMEMLAVQLRIFGRNFGKNFAGDPANGLLERSEAAAAAISLRMQRYRQQCFLGKVLVDLRQVPSVADYLPIAEMLESLPSNLERSRILVWLAEAGWEAGWLESMGALSLPQRGVLESDRAMRLAEVLRRYSAHRQALVALGDPAEDAVRLSGEEFEALYFNPFAEEDCDCY
ncbi:MAG: hypothetical protein FWG73_03095 [Planctomycetaceae bacterium]|nr:hypothetical protein [Planctomycetaceae bacterium]